MKNGGKRISNCRVLKCYLGTFLCVLFYITIFAQGGSGSSIVDPGHPAVSVDTVLDIGLISIADQLDFDFGIRCYRLDLAGSGQIGYCSFKRDRSDPAPLLRS